MTPSDITALVERLKPLANRARHVPNVADEYLLPLDLANRYALKKAVTTRDTIALIDALEQQAARIELDTKMLESMFEWAEYRGPGPSLGEFQGFMKNRDAALSQSTGEKT